MIDCAVERYRISPRRIFVVGLSAGGAMAAALLALFPDRFEAGAAIAGLPYGSAANALEALDAMQNGAEKFADLRVLEPERTHWPRLAIWQGLDDRVVHPANGRRLAEQWAGAFGPGVVPVSVEPAGERATARRWKDRAGRTLVELIQIKDFGHGAPVDSRLGRVASDYMIDSEVDSSRAIAAFWGLLPGEADASEARDDASLSRRWREQVERARRLLDREGGSGPSQGSNPVDPG
jgi:poly(3-hydroxybutyrate) depolymerase